MLKKNGTIFVMIVWLMYTPFSFSRQTNVQYTAVSYKEVTVLDKGVKRKIRIPKDDTQKEKYNLHTSKQLSSQKGIIVSFKNPPVSVVDMEEKYGLKLQKKLLTGYYIFQNVSQYSDIQIVERMMKNETNLKTVKPNWSKRNIPR